MIIHQISTNFNRKSENFFRGSHIFAERIIGCPMGHPDNYNICILYIRLYLREDVIPVGFAIDGSKGIIFEDERSITGINKTIHIDISTLIEVLV